MCQALIVQKLHGFEIIIMIRKKINVRTHIELGIAVNQSTDEEQWDIQMSEYQSEINYEVQKEACNLQNKTTVRKIKQTNLAFREEEVLAEDQIQGF